MPHLFVSYVPNILTIGRIFGTIFMVFYYYLGTLYKFEILWSIFLISAISDFFDGYISRKFNAISALGKCLDPISDKLLLIVSIIILIDAKLINLIVAFVLVSREIIISGLREFLSLQKVELPVSRVAKWKTAFQLLGVGMCFFIKAEAVTSYYIANFGDYLSLYPLTFVIKNLEYSTYVILTLATLTTVYTGFSYIYNSAKYLKK